MDRTVYVDLFFMINFSMDFLCIFLTSKLLSGRTRVIRWVCAAVVGGIYADIALFMPIDGIWEIVVDVVVCALMCFIAFGVKDSLFLHTSVYIVISVAVGGGMTALSILLNKADIGVDEIEGDGISVWLLVILAVISGAVTLLGGRTIKRRSSKRYADVIIEIFGRTRCFRAFCDSGNLLRDPISGSPCVLVRRAALNDILPEELRVADVTGLMGMDREKGKRIRLIPASSALGEGMLVAFRADSVKISNGGEREVDALVALVDADRFGGECDLLLPSELLI